MVMCGSMLLCWHTCRWWPLVFVRSSGGATAWLSCATGVAMSSCSPLTMKPEEAGKRQPLTWNQGTCLDDNGRTPLSDMPGRWLRPAKALEWPAKDPTFWARAICSTTKTRIWIGCRVQPRSERMLLCTRYAYPNSLAVCQFTNLG